MNIMDNEQRVYVVIGISHSGKSSFVRNTFIRGRVPELKRDLMPYSELDDCCLIGRYDTGEKRRDGTDSIERKMVGVLAQQVMNLSSYGKPIVLEGMRCISRPMMNSLLANGFHPTLIWLKCSVETSANRNNAWGTEVKDIGKLA